MIQGFTVQACKQELNRGAMISIDAPRSFAPAGISDPLADVAK